MLFCLTGETGKLVQELSGVLPDCPLVVEDRNYNAGVASFMLPFFIIRLKVGPGRMWQKHNIIGVGRVPTVNLHEPAPNISLNTEIKEEERNRIKSILVENL